MSDDDKHWLVRRSTIRLLWVAFVGLLALTLVAGLSVHQHEVFGIEDNWLFYSGYGFLSCILMVIFAKLLGIFLKRPEDYYDTPSQQDPQVPPASTPEKAPPAGGPNHG